jgi:hypothetical protein
MNPLEHDAAGPAADRASLDRIHKQVVAWEPSLAGANLHLGWWATAAKR